MIQFLRKTYWNGNIVNTLIKLDIMMGKKQFNLFLNELFFFFQVFYLLLNKMNIIFEYLQEKRKIKLEGQKYR